MATLTEQMAGVREAISTIVQTQAAHAEAISGVHSRLDEQIRALQAKIVELETREAKNRENVSHIIAHADVMVRYAVGLECWFNKNVPSILTAFSWVKPFELGAIACPPEDQRYYLPYYLSPDGPVLPPAQ